MLFQNSIYQTQSLLTSIVWAILGEFPLDFVCLSNWCFFTFDKHHYATTQFLAITRVTNICWCDQCSWQFGISLLSKLCVNWVHWSLKLKGQLSFKGNHIFVSDEKIKTLIFWVLSARFYIFQHFNVKLQRGHLVSGCCVHREDWVVLLGSAGSGVRLVKVGQVGRWGEPN